MIGVTELRSGSTYEENGTIFQVLSYEHIKMGRGSATIKVKVKNLRNGSTTDKTFINNARVQNVALARRELQFLYKDDEFYYFMDPRTFEQIQVDLKKIPEHEYLKEGEQFVISFLDSEPLSLQLPPKMDFKISETGPSTKGNSATNVFKDAILENGLKVKVPLFIKIGDAIRVDTRTGSYSEKV